MVISITSVQLILQKSTHLTTFNPYFAASQAEEKLQMLDISEFSPLKIPSNWASAGVCTGRKEIKAQYILKYVCLYKVSSECVLVLASRLCL